jgi:hypothetical protein
MKLRFCEELRAFAGCRVRFQTSELLEIYALHVNSNGLSHQVINGIHLIGQVLQESDFINGVFYFQEPFTLKVGVVLTLSILNQTPQGVKAEGFFAAAPPVQSFRVWGRTLDCSHSPVKDSCQWPTLETS